MAGKPLEAPGSADAPQKRKSALRSLKTQRTALSFEARPGMRRVLGSMIEVDKSLSAAAAVVQAAHEEEERDAKEKARVAARADIVRLLRQQPGIYKAIGMQQLGKSMTDAELLKAFALVDSPAKVLRLAGSTPRDITIIVQLIPAAYAKPKPPRIKTEEEQDDETALEKGYWLVMVFWVLAGLMFVAGLGLGAATIWKMQEEAGWTFGKCEIAKFTAGHGNCTDRSCGFDVLAWEHGAKRIAEQATRVPNWKLPLKGEGTASLNVEGDAFRCCNLDRSFQCCGWYDKKLELYCDSWVYKRDRDGAPCPEPPWPCRFQYAPGNAEEIERLEEASGDKSSLWQLGGPAIALGAAGAGIAACLALVSGRLLVSRLGARVRHILEGDRGAQIAELEAARLESLDPVLRPPEQRKVAGRNGKSVRPPLPLPQQLPQPEGAPGESHISPLSSPSEGAKAQSPIQRDRRGGISGIGTMPKLARKHAGALDLSAFDLADGLEANSPRLEVEDVEEASAEKNPGARDFSRLKQTAFVNHHEMLRPILTPLPPNKLLRNKQRQRGGRKGPAWTVQKEEAPAAQWAGSQMLASQGPGAPAPPQGKEAWRVVDL